MNENFKNITLKPISPFEENITGGSFALNWETENDNGSVTYNFGHKTISFDFIGKEVDPSILLIDFYDNFTVRSDIDEKFEVINNQLKREPRIDKEENSKKETVIHHSECSVIAPYKSHDGGFVISWSSNIGFGETAFIIRNGIVFVDGELLFHTSIRKILSSIVFPSKSF